ncbi:hypothetical protein Q1J68_17425 [Pseudomonas pergaminensis]|uniref:hypothetical protein n=1 Tax=Pseudomonas pergaminensis TaxID=2853159 RepID=UPI0034D6ED81
MKIIKTTDSVSSPKYERWKGQWEDQSELDEFSYISDILHPEDALLFLQGFIPGFCSSRIRSISGKQIYC